MAKLAALKYRKPYCWHEASDPPEDFRGGEEGGGAFHCFCPRAPKTIVTPLIKSPLTPESLHQKNFNCYLVLTMISGESQKPVQKAARWLCGVCGRGVGSNSIQCTSCHKWVHKKCSG